jgi:hypothetical protein
MSYKTTLLKENKMIIEDLKNEIREIIKTNEQILKFENVNEWDLNIVENNLKRIEEKENLIKAYLKNAEQILKEVA